MFDLFDDITKPDIDWKPDCIDADAASDLMGALIAEVAWQQDIMSTLGGRALPAPDRVTGRDGRGVCLLWDQKRAAALDACGRFTACRGRKSLLRCTIQQCVFEPLSHGTGQHGLARGQGTRTRAEAGEHVHQSGSHAHLRVSPREDACDARARSDARQLVGDARTHAARMDSSRASAVTPMQVRAGDGFG